LQSSAKPQRRWWSIWRDEKPTCAVAENGQIWEIVAFLMKIADDQKIQLLNIIAGVLRKYGNDMVRSGDYTIQSPGTFLNTGFLTNSMCLIFFFGICGKTTCTYVAHKVKVALQKCACWSLPPNEYCWSTVAVIGYLVTGAPRVGSKHICS